MNNQQKTQISIPDRLAVLRDDYAKKLPNKLVLISEIWQKLTYFSWNQDAFSTLFRLIHNLTGSGSTFGYAQLSARSRKLEDYLSPLISKESMPTDVERLTIQSLIGELISSSIEMTRVNVDDVSSSGASHSVSKVSEKTIYIVDDDNHICLYLNTLLSSVGYNIRTFSNPTRAQDYLDKCVPDLVIMDINFPVGCMSGYDSVNEIRSHAGKRIPFIFISSHTDLVARIKTVRAGGDAYFSKPIDLASLNKKIFDLTNIAHSEKYRILIVDDDVELSNYSALLLQDTGMDTLVINKPIDIIRKVEQYRPDLVVMDLHMPDYNGIELATVLRQIDSMIGLPIVFFTSETREEYRNEAFSIGANEYLQKPVDGNELVNVINKQIRISRQVNNNIRKVTKKDPLSGLSSQQYFLEKLEISLLSFISSEKRYLVDISIDDFQQLKEKFGIEWLDSFNQQISTAVGNVVVNDAIATRFSDSVYMVLLSNATLENVLDYAKKIIKTISCEKFLFGNQHQAMTASIGIVEINENINSVHELLRHAEDVSGKVQENGGNAFKFHEVLPVKEQHKRALRDSIHIAFKNKDFQLVYQPIVDIENQQCEMYEVLLRMLDSEGRTILPSQFIPYAIETRSVVTMDRWVIDNAIESLTNNSHTKNAADFFIKISAETLSEPLLIAWISNALSLTSINGVSRVVFHVNEKDVALKSNIDLVRNLHKLNCGFAIDHFSISDKSMKMMKIIKPDYIMVRQSVLDKVTVDENKQENIKRLIKVANEFGITIIASNIEDPATLSLLWGFGIRHFQGYFIKSPDESLEYNFGNSVL